MSLPGFGIKITLVAFQGVGMWVKAIDALYMYSINLRMLGGRCWNTTGLSSSGPGDFLLSKVVRDFLIFLTHQLFFFLLLFWLFGFLNLRAKNISEILNFVSYF